VYGDINQNGSVNRDAFVTWIGLASMCGWNMHRHDAGSQMCPRRDGGACQCRARGSKMSDMAAQVRRRLKVALSGILLPSGGMNPWR
jgi:hypothetical protein